MLATGCSPSEFEAKAAHTFFPQPDLPPDAKIYQRMVPTSDADIESAFTMQELIMALDSVNAKSAPGKDGITWQLLRNLSEPGKEQFKEEINKVWLSGEIPAEWKHSVVSPIPKPGKAAHDVSNLRPISLTSTLCKLLERLVLTRLTYHLEESHNEPYFDPSQTGFRPGLCTQDSLFLLRRCTRKRWGRQKVPGILVAADLRKAFDSVTHEAVISALEEARPGIRIVNIVKSFLDHRTFEIRQMTTKAMQHALDRLTDYLKGTGMQLSLEKTKYILPGGTVQEKEKVELYLAGQKLERAPQHHVKILGIPIHEGRGAATWLKELEPTWKKLLHLVKRISQKRGGAGTDTARTLTSAVLTSRACYGAVCFDLTKA
ncbi:hypothetical protein HPB49_013634 [Dermacentor silvarum]|uniref:Uncharacterized protein n=1 Tax=Dermacentor silvarum TaxID=543639 RepID=A0ACB8CL18_DERSI|nr:hypothetical protein HPB49_013634 [Dermacentor silvarum]